ncbi:hypothetical protein CGRA01v4_04945 [Colletotrichum graminicola]|nr:hypothetical protein CGRA01v4_04945 [Colletotrichum graminicola]
MGDAVAMIEAWSGTPCLIVSFALATMIWMRNDGSGRRSGYCLDGCRVAGNAIEPVGFVVLQCSVTDR